MNVYDCELENPLLEREGKQRETREDFGNAHEGSGQDGHLPTIRKEKRRRGLWIALVTLFSVFILCRLGTQCLFGSAEGLLAKLGLHSGRVERHQHRNGGGETSIVIPTHDGPVRGVRVNGTMAFLGIPFAMPPMHNLRFASPVAPTKWTEPLNTTTFAPGCPQKCDLPDLMCPAQTSEDCLYLNVYAPDPDKKAPKGGWPVYVFIHGGSFLEGAGGTPAYNGYSFVNKGNVILVNMNYRLGALGWLAYNDIKGNFGLQDQRLAMQWVQDNIENFGGDKTRVTLGGESAGAISVIGHLVSPWSKGLFHKAIIESGPLALPFNQYNSPNKFYDKFVTDAHCEGAQYVAECLRSMPVETLLKIQEHITIIPFPHPFHYLLPWMPTYANAEMPFHPYLAFKGGEFNKVPFIAGANEEDARAFIYAALDFALPKSAFEAILTALFGTQTWSVLSMYEAQEDDNREVFSQIGTDLIMTCGARFIADSFRKQNVPAFVYTFGYRFWSSFWGPYGPFCNGHSCHGGELPFVFDLFEEKSMSYLNHSIADEKLGHTMNQYWSDFVKKDFLQDGKEQPAAGGSSVETLADWPLYNSATQEWMNFTSDQPNITRNFRDTYCDFWDSLGYMFWQ